MTADRFNSKAPPPTDYVLVDLWLQDDDFEFFYFEFITYYAVSNYEGTRR